MYHCLTLGCCSNRKGKLIFFYEWNVKLKWKGTLTPEDPPTDDEKESKDVEEYSGSIEIPNLSEENEPEDIDVSPCTCLTLFCVCESQSPFGKEVHVHCLLWASWSHCLHVHVRMHVDMVSFS